MRDATGERAHRLQLLRLPQLHLEAILLGLGALARRHIDRRSDEAARPAFGIAHAAGARQDPVPLPIGLPNAIFELVAIGASLEVFAKFGVDPRAVVGMYIGACQRLRP